LRFENIISGYLNQIVYIKKRERGAGLIFKVYFSIRQIICNIIQVMSIYSLQLQKNIKTKERIFYINIQNRKKKYSL
jgi:hypothetical protein